MMENSDLKEKMKEMPSQDHSFDKEFDQLVEAKVQQTLQDKYGDLLESKPSQEKEVVVVEGKVVEERKTEQPKEVSPVPEAPDTTKLEFDAMNQKQRQRALISLEYNFGGEWVRTDGRKDSDSFNMTNDMQYGSDLVTFVPKHVRKIPAKSLQQVVAEETAFYNRNKSLDPTIDFTSVNTLRSQQIPAQFPNEASSVPPAVNFHHYTPEETQQCLKNKRILMVGDSHMRNLWRGLMDSVVGMTCNSYERWDGYEDLPDHLAFPVHVPEEWGNNHHFPHLQSAAGRLDHCRLKNATERTFQGLRTYYQCPRSTGKYFDLDERSFPCTACKENNFQVSFSNCALSLQNVLASDPTGKTQGEVCRMNPNQHVFEIGNTTSQWERMLDYKEPYDLIIAGFHTHDIKKDNCKGVRDWKTCRREKGHQLLENADKFAKMAADRKADMIWVTVNSENLLTIPEKYREFQQTAEVVFERLAMESIMRHYGHRVMDPFYMSIASHITKTVQPTWPSAHIHGSHTTRYMARMQGQILLNSICGGEQE